MRQLPGWTEMLSTRWCAIPSTHNVVKTVPWGTSKLHLSQCLSTDDRHFHIVKKQITTGDKCTETKNSIVPKTFLVLGLLEYEIFKEDHLP